MSVFCGQYFCDFRYKIVSNDSSHIVLIFYNRYKVDENNNFQCRYIIRNAKKKLQELTKIFNGLIMGMSNDYSKILAYNTR